MPDLGHSLLRFSIISGLPDQALNTWTTGQRPSAYKASMTEHEHWQEDCMLFLLILENFAQSGTGAILPHHQTRHVPPVEKDTRRHEDQHR